MAVVIVFACGCGGTIDGSTTVITSDGKPHVIADVYGASAGAEALGDWTLFEIDTAASTSRTLLSLRADGELDVTSIDSTTVYDDLHGDRLVPVVTQLCGGRGRARWRCEIGNRWRMVDAHRIGILFTCDDALGREAIFSFAASSSFFSPSNTPNSGRSYPLVLDTLGDEAGMTVRSAPAAAAVYGFALSAANE